jgi:hypothetical protein
MPVEAAELFDRLTGDQADPKALPEWRQCLARDPEVLDAVGSFRALAERRLIHDYAGEQNLAIREALKARVTRLRRELAGPLEPSPLEVLLVERVAFCWLSLYHAERRALDDGGQSFRQAEYLQKRVDKCSRRFLAACKGLATIRKLAMPGTPLIAVQNNIISAVKTPGSGAD